MSLRASNPLWHNISFNVHVVAMPRERNIDHDRGCCVATLRKINGPASTAQLHMPTQPEVAGVRLLSRRDPEHVFEQNFNLP
jgi:hypothetical protein